MNRCELREIIAGKLREFDMMYRRGTETRKLESTVEIWTDALMEYRDAVNFAEALDRALLEHVKASKFFPVPSEVMNIMAYWVKKEPAPTHVEHVSAGRWRHNAEVAQAIRLAIRKDAGARREGLMRLCELKVLDEEGAARFMGNI